MGSINISGKRIKEIAVPLISFPLIHFLNHLSLQFSKKIGNQEDLEQIVKDEKEKLGIEGNIKTTFTNEYNPLNSGEVHKLGENDYELILPKGANSRTAIRHELYHIYKSHLNEENQIKPENHTVFGYVLRNAFDMMCISEPQAILYQIFNLKT